jgi:2-C-methyl-D-erythritol 4-phosphate cytidylyltransferase
MTMPIWFVLVAAGRGSRMGLDVPKQFLPCCGKEIFRHSLDTFLAVPEGGVLLVLAPEWEAAFAENYPIYRPALSQGRLLVTAGGGSRAESVAHGLDRLRLSLAQGDNPLVAVHDAARPLLTQQTLLELKDKASQLEARTLLLAGRWSRDTVLRADEAAGEVMGSLPREQIFLAETPQAFWLNDYFAARQAVGEPWRELTDESSLFLRAGFGVRPWPLSQWNFKLTYEDDLELLSALAARSGPSLTAG